MMSNTEAQSLECQADHLVNAQMRLPAPGKAAAALLKKRQRQSHRRSEAFYAERNR